MLNVLVNRLVSVTDYLTRIGLTLALLISASQASAVIEILEFNTEAEKVRYQELIDELRCPKCQNQNLADSNAQIAIDLRNKVRELIDQGKSDEEIKDHLVARYGDFVLYRPEVKKETYVLWYGPFILLGFGALIVVIVLLNNRRKSNETKNEFSSEQERQERLKKLLNENSEKE